MTDAKQKDSRTVRIDDLALFFSKNNTIVGVWVPHAVYTSPARVLGAANGWKDTIFTQARAANDALYFVTNLANLEPPGEPPSTTAVKEARGDNSKRKPQAGLVAEAGDLVIVPYDDPAHAYLVKEKDYQNPDVCPPIAPTSGADLNFLALTQGAVLANIPKQDLAGMTCYLLNLSALASE